MKRLLALASLLLIMSVSVISAETVTLIDFSLLGADTETDGGKPLNSATVIDFGQDAGSQFTAEDKAKMKVSLELGSWEVELASSSQSITNIRQSYTAEAPVKDTATKYGGSVVLGIRIHFPENSYNSWAIVKPPFEIPAFQDKTAVDGFTVSDEDKGKGEKFDAPLGVAKNVGIIKSISMEMYGSNFPHAVGVILQDQNFKRHEFLLGRVEFDGWNTLVWDNPNYDDDVANRKLKKYALYPNAMPYYKFIGIIFYRDANHIGGDFITYVKQVDITFDLAVLEPNRDIDDEAIWGILQEREEARRMAEYKRLGDIQVLRYLEEQKMHKEEDTTTTP